VKVKGEARVGLVAGEGKLPILIARSIENRLQDVAVWALEGIASPEIDEPHRIVRWVEMGKFQDLIESIRTTGVRDLVLAGKVHISRVLTPYGFDERLSALLQNVQDLRGHTLLGAVVDELDHEGFNVLSNLAVASDLITPAGHLAGPALESRQLEDIRVGWDFAKESARRDAGQTVVVKAGAIVAVEAMEGTSMAIRRAAELAGDGIVAVKVASDDHDPRFDIPTVGPETVSALLSVGCGVLAVEAGRTFLIDGKEVRDVCEKAGVSLLGVDASILAG
jgi:DUF1009 family protein